MENAHTQEAYYREVLEFIEEAHRNAEATFAEASKNFTNPEVKVKVTSGIMKALTAAQATLAILERLRDPQNGRLSDVAAFKWATRYTETFRLFSRPGTQRSTDSMYDSMKDVTDVASFDLAEGILSRV